MANVLDPQIGNSILTKFIEDLIEAKGGLPATKPFEIATKPIVEYENRMRFKTTDNFDVAVYIAAISFYISQADMNGHRARGALVLYMNTEVADKIFKAAGLQVPYDEDDESMMELCGNLCQIIIEHFNERLTAEGFAALMTSTPAVFRNNIPDGVEISKDLEEKQEISFYYLKHKALVIDWALSSIPKK